MGRSRPIRSHGRRKRRVPVWAILVVLMGLAALGAGVRYLPGSPFSAGPVNGQPSGEQDLLVEPTPAPEPLPFRSAPVTAASVGTKGFVSWAVMDRRTGEITGSANMATTSTTMSMIKVWFASDYLRLATERNEEPTTSRLNDLELMIQRSDNAATMRTIKAVGLKQSINRLVKTCELTETAYSSLGFGYTKISARDAVRLGNCVADGRASGPKWTSKVLEWMRSVQDGTLTEGNFGIPTALPEDQRPQVAIKNGWDIWHEDGTYRTNCLGVGDTWVLSVLLQYPSSGNDAKDLEHNAEVCTTVAQQLLNPDAS